MKKVTISLLFILFVVTGCMSLNEPPEAKVKTAEKTIDTAKGSYHWERGNSAVIADAASPALIAEEMEADEVKQGDKAEVVFSDHSHPDLDAYIWNDNRRGEKLAVNNDQVALPEKPGKYIVELFATWKNGKASYTFVVEID